MDPYGVTLISAVPSWESGVPPAGSAVPKSTDRDPVAPCLAVIDAASRTPRGRL